MVGWIQLDNQTRDPVAPVVVAPTTVENPQATLQMSFIRNNAKSHSHLNHFEVSDGSLMYLPHDGMMLYFGEVNSVGENAFSDWAAFAMSVLESVSSGLLC